MPQKGGAMPDKKMLRHMHIVLAEDEFNTLKKNAKQCGLTRTAYLRALIKKTPVKSRPPKELQILYAEINKIGHVVCCLNCLHQ